MISLNKADSARGSNVASDILGGDSDLSELSCNEELPTVRVSTPVRVSTRQLRPRSEKRERDHSEPAPLDDKEYIIRRTSSRTSLNSKLSAPVAGTPRPSLETLSVAKTPKKRRHSISSGSAPKRAKISPSCYHSPFSRSTSKHLVIYDPDQIVWIRLDVHGLVVHDEIDEGELSYWWPAIVTKADPVQITVELIGSDGKGPRRCVTIGMPSSSTVLPFKDDDRIRFSEDNFLFSDSLSLQSELPADLTKRWRKACNEAQEMALNNQDDLPDIFSLINSAESGKKSSQTKDDVMVRSSTRVEHRAVTPLDENLYCDPDDGELVLAKAHKNRADHWPARVIGVSQDSRTGRWLYKLQFIGETSKKVERSAFFSSEEDGFATCRVGHWETIIPSDDSEMGSDDEFHRLNDDGPEFPSTAISNLEAIEDVEAFQNRPMAEQLYYVYPFLCRIIRREYGPVLKRHEAFLKGGKAREALAKTAGKGHLSDNEVQKVEAYVRKMMLHDERWAKRTQSGYSSVKPLSSCSASEGEKGSAISDITVSHTPNHAPCQCSVETSQGLSSSILPENDPKHPTPDVALQTELSDIRPPSNPSVVQDNEETSELTTESHEYCPKRPLGCEEYEALTPTDRTMYCTDILIPEAIIQLHLFRAGCRKSTDLLSPVEEMELHEQGNTLVEKNNVHWVVRIMELRKMAERGYKRRNWKKQELVLSSPTGESRSRLRSRKN